MTTLLPKDADDNAIPALRLKDGGAHNIAVTALSAKNTLPFDPETKVISLYATGPVYLKLGDSSVTASNTDHFFPAGVYYDIAVSGGGGKAAQDTYLAAIRADTDCTLYISEKQ